MQGGRVSTCNKSVRSHLAWRMQAFEGPKLELVFALLPGAGYVAAAWQTW